MDTTMSFAHEKPTHCQISEGAVIVNVSFSPQATKVFYTFLFGTFRSQSLIHTEWRRSHRDSHSFFAFIWLLFLSSLLSSGFNSPTPFRPKKAKFSHDNCTWFEFLMNYRSSQTKAIHGSKARDSSETWLIFYINETFRTFAARLGSHSPYQLELLLDTTEENSEKHLRLIFPLCIMCATFWYRRDITVDWRPMIVQHRTGIN